MLNGKIFGEVLIPTFSRDTPAGTRERIVGLIAEKEGFGEITLYCSRDARQANMSASYAEQNPDAFRTCYLGAWNDGEFIAGERLFP